MEYRIQKLPEGGYVVFDDSHLARVNGMMTTPLYASFMVDDALAFVRKKLKPELPEIKPILERWAYHTDDGWLSTEEIDAINEVAKRQLGDEAFLGSVEMEKIIKNYVTFKNTFSPLAKETNVTGIIYAWKQSRRPDGIVPVDSDMRPTGKAWGEL